MGGGNQNFRGGMHQQHQGGNFGGGMGGGHGHELNTSRNGFYNVKLLIGSSSAYSGSAIG